MCRCIFKQHIYTIYIYIHIYIITHTLKLMFYAQPPCPSLMPGAALLSERRDASGLACQHEKNKQEKGSKLHIGLGCVVLGLLAACRRHATARRCQVTRGRRGPGGTRAHVLNALGHSSLALFIRVRSCARSLRMSVPLPLSDSDIKFVKQASPNTAPPSGFLFAFTTLH